jgi:hypothetical protein
VGLEDAGEVRGNAEVVLSVSKVLKGRGGDGIRPIDEVKETVGPWTATLKVEVGIGRSNPVLRIIV